MDIPSCKSKLEPLIIWTNALTSKMSKELSSYEKITNWINNLSCATGRDCVSLKNTNSFLLPKNWTESGEYHFV